MGWLKSKFEPAPILYSLYSFNAVFNPANKF